MRIGHVGGILVPMCTPQSWSLLVPYNTQICSSILPGFHVVPPGALDSSDYLIDSFWDGDIFHLHVCLHILGHGLSTYRGLRHGFKQRPTLKFRSRIPTLDSHSLLVQCMIGWVPLEALLRSWQVFWHWWYPYRMCLGLYTIFLFKWLRNICSFVFARIGDRLRAKSQFAVAWWMATYCQFM